MSENNKFKLIKTSIIGLLILSFLSLALLFYFKEWNTKITNNNLNIVIDNQGLDYITEKDHKRVYTYNLKQVYLINSSGTRTIYLKQAFDENYINIDFLIANLSFQEYLDYTSYKSFEYQIIFDENVVIICPLEENIINIIEEISIK